MWPKLLKLSDRIENTVEKGENAGDQHFLIFPQCFQKSACLRWLKARIVSHRVKMLLEKLKHFTKRQSFELVQIENICRLQNKFDSKTEIYFGKGRKHCGKRRKSWLPAFSPFSSMSSKGFFLRFVISQDCVVKS